MSGIKIKYSELFTAAIRHEYYNDNITGRYTVEPTPDFTIIPSPQTIRLMQRLDLLLRINNRNAGFTVLAAVKDGAGPNIPLRFQSRAADTLVFFFVLNNASLINYSNIPAALRSDELFYCTNNRSTVVPDRINLPLSKGSKLAASDDLFKISNGTYQFISPSLTDVITIRHLYTTKEISAASIIRQGGNSFHVFKLDSLPEGICAITVNGIVTNEAFYYVGAGAPPQIFAAAVFYLDNSIPQKFRIIELGNSLTPDRPQYLVTIGQRPTTWRYTIKLTPGSALFEEFKLVAGAARETFFKINTNDTGIVFAHHADNDTSIVLQSSTAIPLKEQFISGSASAPLTLTLEKTGGITLKKDLPQSGQGVVDATQPPDIYSDILITL